MKTVADSIVAQLSAWGIQRIYGVAGDTLIPLLDAIDRHADLRYVPARNEAAAGFMASAEAKLTGRPGLCIATSGPGIANLLNGLGDASADRVPVLAITGQVETDKIGTDAKQYVDQQTLVRPLAAYTALLAHPEACGKVLTTALRTAIAEGRVAHVSVPMDLFPMACNARVTPPEPYLNAPPAVEPIHIQGAAALMEQARRPLILMGRGARPAGAGVARLAERWGAGLIQSLPAKGSVPWSHPLVLGGLGDSGTDAAHTALQEADLLLTVGCNWWPEFYTPQHLPVIKVDRSPIHVGGHMNVRFGVAGDVRTVIPMLMDVIPTAHRPEWRDRVATLRREWDARLEYEVAADGPPFSPQHIVRVLERALPPDAVVTLDTGDHTVWFGRVFGGEAQEVLVSGNWRSLGFGLPAALAAKLAEPHRTVVALVGDTALQSQLGELVTAAQQGVPLTVVVVNNGVMAIEKHRAQERGYSVLGTEPRNPDFAAVAAACGFSQTFRPDSAESLAEALRTAMSANGPVLIDVPATAPVAPTAAHM